MAIQISNLKKSLALIKKNLASYKKVFFAIIILASLAYLGAIFYFYAWKIKLPEHLPTQSIYIDSALYQKTMDDLSQREINFIEEANKTYFDPFYQ